MMRRARAPKGRGGRFEPERYVAVAARLAIATLALGASPIVGCDAQPIMTVRSTPRAAALALETGANAPPVRSHGCGPPDRPTATVLTNEEIVVTFDKPLRGRATNQYWIVLARAGAPESDTMGRSFLDRGVTSTTLRAMAPGQYEVRLHGDYPRREHHLIARVPVTVRGWPAKAAPDATISAQ